VKAWWEIQVLTDPALEDLLFWRLEDFGCRGASSQTQGSQRLVQGYLPQEQAAEAQLQRLAQQLAQDAQSLQLAFPQVQWRLINEEDWSSSWKQYWHPQAVGERLLILPAWLNPPESSERLVLRLDPGTAFGTGQHATTQLCLEALEMQLNPAFDDYSNWVLADIGCGSGILSIAAVLLGAAKIYAVDVDPLAVDAAAHNRDLNQISSAQLPVHQGSLAELTALLKQPVDGFVCNILAEVILRLIPQLGQIAQPGTWGVLSGILVSQAPAIAAALETNQWELTSVWRQEDWCCLNIRRL